MSANQECPICFTNQRLMPQICCNGQICMACYQAVNGSCPFCRCDDFDRYADQSASAEYAESVESVESEEDDEDGEFQISEQALKRQRTNNGVRVTRRITYILSDDESSESEHDMAASILRQLDADSETESDWPSDWHDSDSNGYEEAKE